MTFEEESTSNECKTKSFEDILWEQFKKYEQDWDGLERVMETFRKQQQEEDGTITKEDR